MLNIEVLGIFVHWTCYLLSCDRGVEAALGIILNPVMSDLVIIVFAV